MKNIPRTMLYFGFTTYVFLQNAREFFPEVAAHVKNEDRQKLIAIKRVLGPSSDHSYWQLSYTFWDAKVMQDLIGLDMLGGELREQKSRNILMSSLPVLMRQISSSVSSCPWYFELNLISKNLSQSIVKLFENCGLSDAYEQDQVDAQKTLNTTLFQVAMERVNQLLRQLQQIQQPSAHHWKVLAFAYGQAAEFAEDVLQKAQLYLDASNAKDNEVLVLNTEGKRKQKKEALAQVATYRKLEAEAHTDPNRKAHAYYLAGGAKWSEAELLHAEDEHPQRRDLWAQAAIHFEKAAEAYIDPNGKVLAYHRANIAKDRSFEASSKIL